MPSQNLCEDRCFAGISLGHPNFEDAKLISLFNWIDCKYRNCIVLLPDSVYATSLQVTRRVNHKLATELSKQLSHQFVRLYSNYFSALTGDFHIVKSSSIEQSTSYQHFWNELLDEFNKNAELHHLLSTSSTIFLSRNNLVDESDDIESRRLKNLSNRFLLQELCIACCLVQEDYKTSIYPGNIDLFNKLSNINPSKLPTPLTLLTNVRVQYKRRSSTT